MTFDPESGRHYYPTGRHRLRPHGQLVVLQIEETMKYPAMPVKRWRDASPQDVMEMVGIALCAGTITLATAGA